MAAAQITQALKKCMAKQANEHTDTAPLRSVRGSKADVVVVAAGDTNIHLQECYDNCVEHNISYLGV